MTSSTEQRAEAFATALAELLISRNLRLTFGDESFDVMKDGIEIGRWDTPYAGGQARTPGDGRLDLYTLDLDGEPIDHAAKEILKELATAINALELEHRVAAMIGDYELYLVPEGETEISTYTIGDGTGWRGEQELTTFEVTLRDADGEEYTETEEEPSLPALLDNLRYLTEDGTTIVAIHAGGERLQ